MPQDANNIYGYGINAIAGGEEGLFMPIDEIERIETTLGAQLQQLPNAKWTISKTEPDIGDLRFGPDGNLWVGTSRGGFDQPEGVFYTWDVFDADGHFLEQVSAACPRARVTTTRWPKSDRRSNQFS